METASRTKSSKDLKIQRPEENAKVLLNCILL